MSWKEVKEAIEKAGIRDDDKIWHINIHPIESQGDFVVCYDPPFGVRVLD